MSLARELSTLAEAALSSASLLEYDRALFDCLARTVGFDVGILKRGHAFSPVCPGLDAQVARACVPYWPTFQREMTCRTGPISQADRASNAHPIHHAVSPALVIGVGYPARASQSSMPSVHSG